YWTLEDVGVGPTPHRPGGPAIWWGGSGPTALREAARADGWFPIDPRTEVFRDGLGRIRTTAREAGRSVSAITPALYTTVVLGARSRARPEREAFLSTYSTAPAAAMLQRRACYAGEAEGCLEGTRRFVEVGARHLIVRFAGRADHLTQLERVARELLPRLVGL